MTTTEPTTEEAFWLSIGEKPDDQLPRLVLADWYDERAGRVVCVRCHGAKRVPRLNPWGPDSRSCPTCTGTGYVPDRNGRLAAALRATSDRVPLLHLLHLLHTHSWALHVVIPDRRAYKVDRELWERLTGHVPADHPSWKDYPTAAAAIRDLCEAWCRVTYGEALA